MQCQPGQYAAEGATECTPCVSGTADVDNLASTPCVSCATGQYSDNEATACTNCTARACTGAAPAACIGAVVCELNAEGDGCSPSSDSSCQFHAASDISATCTGAYIRNSSCTGSHDGAGGPCTLNANRTACNVMGGDCVFTVQADISKHRRRLRLSCHTHTSCVHRQRHL